MADYVIPENLAVAIGVAATAVGGFVAKVATSMWRSKNEEVARLSAKIESLQAEYKALLMAQIEAEPARKAALEKIGQALADQNQLVKTLLQKQG